MAYCRRSVVSYSRREIPALKYSRRRGTCAPDKWSNGWKREKYCSGIIQREINFFALNTASLEEHRGEEGTFHPGHARLSYTPPPPWVKVYSPPPPLRALIAKAVLHLNQTACREINSTEIQDWPLLYNLNTVSGRGNKEDARKANFKFIVGLPWAPGIFQTKMCTLVPLAWPLGRFEKACESSRELGSRDSVFCCRKMAGFCVLIGDDRGLVFRGLKG